MIRRFSLESRIRLFHMGSLVNYVFLFLFSFDLHYIIRCFTVKVTPQEDEFGWSFIIHMCG